MRNYIFPIDNKKKYVYDHFQRVFVTKNNAWAKTMTNYCRRIIDEVADLCHKEIMTNQPTIQQTNQPTN